jgi:hypothetical protein
MIALNLKGGMTLIESGDDGGVAIDGTFGQKVIPAISRDLMEGIRRHGAAESGRGPHIGGVTVAGGAVDRIGGQHGAAGDVFLVALDAGVAAGHIGLVKGMAEMAFEAGFIHGGLGDGADDPGRARVVAFRAVIGETGMGLRDGAGIVKDDVIVLPGAQPAVKAGEEEGGEADQGGNAKAEPAKIMELEIVGKIPTVALNDLLVGLAHNFK